MATAFQAPRTVLSGYQPSGFQQTVGLPLPPVQPNVYYVRLADGNDTNDGQHAPWKSIVRANAAPAGSTINFWGGDTFQSPSNVATWLQVGVGSTVQSFGTGQATIKPWFSGGTGTINLSNNATCNNLAVEGDGYSHGIVVAGNNCTVQNCTVKHCYIFNSSPFSAGGVLVLLNGHDNTVSGCTLGGDDPLYPQGTGVYVNTSAYNIKILHNEIKNIGGNQISPQQMGFGIHTSGVFPPGWTVPVPYTYSAGVPTNALCEIAYNVIHDCGGNIVNSTGGGPSGIEIGAGDRQYIHDNVVYNIRPWPQFAIPPGTDFDGIDAGDQGASNTLCERNFVYGCIGGGIIDFDGGGLWGPSIVRYNLIVDCGLGSFANTATQDFNIGRNHQWYGNTIVQTTNSGSSGSNTNVMFVQNPNATGVWANNIVVTDYPWYAFRDLNGGGINPSIFSFTHNNWYGDGAGYNFNGTVEPNYAAAKAAASWFDQNGMTSNPQFVGTAGSLTTTDYKLQSTSPCISAGVNLTALGIDVGSTDFFGNPVTAGTPNIGCHAY